MRNSLRRGRSIGIRGLIALAVVLSTVTLGAQTVAAAVPSGEHWIFVDVSIGDSWLGGVTNGTPTAPLDVVLRSADGHLKAAGRAAFHNEGWNVHFAGAHVMVGDRISLTEGRHHLKIVVPQLTLTIDRVSDVLTVDGPPDTAVSIELDDLNGWNETGVERHYVRTDSNGHYVLAAGKDLGGEDYAMVEWDDPDAGGMVTRWASAQHLMVFRDASWFSVVGAAGTHVSIEAHRPDGELRGQAVGVLDDRGVFSGSFRDGSGNRVRIRLGDRVTSDIAPDADLVVPDVRIRGDARSEMVSGRCPPSAPYNVTDGHGRWLSDVTSRAGDDGRFTFDSRTIWNGHYDLVSGDTLRLLCMLGTGDLVGRGAIVP